MFGEIRSIVQNKPSVDVWEDLCQQLSDWSGSEDLNDVVIPYILSHIGSWPYRIRTTPLRWKEGLVRGARLPFAPLVKVLDASHMGLRNEDLHTLAHAPILEHVQAVDLSHNVFGWRGLKNFLEHSKDPTRLRALNLSHTSIGVEGLRLIADTEPLKHLEVLSLSGIQTSPEGLAALTQSPHLHALHTLILSHNNITERYVEALLSGPRFSQITTLALDHNPLGSRGVVRLFHKRSTKNLQALDLSACRLTAPIADLLTQTSSLSKLQTLRVAYNPLVSRAYAFNRDSKLTSLQRLDLQAEGREHPAVLQLLEQGPPPSLRCLGITKTKKSEQITEIADDYNIKTTHHMGIDLVLLPPHHS